MHNVGVRDKNVNTFDGASPPVPREKAPRRITKGAGTRGGNPLARKRLESNELLR